MGTFVRTFLVVTALFLVVGVPVLVVSWQANRKTITRGFAATATGIGVFFGVAAVGSEQLVEDCGGSGSIACLDVGYQGLLFFIGLVYLIASILVAVSIGRR